MFEKILDVTSEVMYSYLLIIILILGGLYFTIRSKFVQFGMTKEQTKIIAEKPKDRKGVSSFQALMVSTASRVGTGNIVGVASALCIGGFGSVFWMWIIALVGSASAFIESTLAQIYKKKGPDGSYGGPAYYIETALKCRPLAIIFSIFLILAYGIGFNMFASHKIQASFSTYSFYDPTVSPWIIGLIVALIVGYCLFGGGKKIVKVTSILVPIMGIAYILVALVIVCLNITTIPYVFGRIFSEAFNFKAIFGGFGGSCVMYGVKRGLFSNEAGVGSAPNAAASAEVSHPVKQGLVQVLSVFIDTILICSATAFMCMCSGVEPSPIYDGREIEYVQAAFSNTLGTFGTVFITIAMILFAFTTLLGNLYYVNQALNHIIGHVPSKITNYLYYILASSVIFIGSGLSSDMLWDIADITMGFMVIINMPVILYLGKYAFRALKDYKRQKKAGKDPVFHAKDIDLPHKVDYWD